MRVKSLIEKESDDADLEIFVCGSNQYGYEYTDEAFVFYMHVLRKDINWI